MRIELVRKDSRSRRKLRRADRSGQRHRKCGVPAIDYLDDRLVELSSLPLRNSDIAAFQDRNRADLPGKYRDFMLANITAPETEPED